jgi:NAD(P)-dependent dehydrogenase (short-subunit alcohol dehydrogenase family)
MTSNSANSDALFSCQDLVVVITGGGSGIGLHCTRALVKSGATVYILGRRLERLQKAAESCTGSGKVIPLQCDTTSKDSLANVVSQIDADVGYINLLFANVGIGGQMPEELQNNQNLPIESIQRLLWDISMDEFLNTFKVNVAGTFWTAIAFLSLLDKGNQRGLHQTSQIIINSSAASVDRNWSRLGMSYNTSKAATNHLVKCLSSYLLDFKIRVNGLVTGRKFSHFFRSMHLPIHLYPINRLNRLNLPNRLHLSIVSNRNPLLSWSI